MRKRSLALLVWTGLLTGPVPSPASYGLVDWSPGGDRAVAYHRGRLVVLEREGGIQVRSDSIPEPAGIAVDWEKGTIFIAVSGDSPRVDVYEPQSTSPAASLAECTSPTCRLAWCGGRLARAGAGFLEMRELPAGGVDSVCWAPSRAPVDLLCSGAGSALLFQDRLLFLGGKEGLLSLGVAGEAIALVPGKEGVRLVVREGSDLLLASPERAEAHLSTLEPGESILGADCSPGASRVLLVLHVEEGMEAESQSRVVVHHGETGERLRSFRSARVVRGAGESFEDPLGAAFGPEEGQLLIVWPSTGAQLWDTGEWSLIANW